MPNDDDESSDSDDLFTRPGPTGDVHWSDDDDEGGGDDENAGGRRRRRRNDADADAKEAERCAKTIPTVPTDDDKKKARIDDPPPRGGVDDDDDDDDAWAREALLESATTPAMKTAPDTDGARALLRALDGLARPPSPTYVPTVRGATTTMRATSGGLGGTRSDSNRRRRDESTALDDDEDDDEPVGMSDSERDDEDLGATTTTRNDDDGGADAFTGEMMTVYFQLPNGKKYERVVGSKMPFRSIVAAWKQSADWADVEETLGSASVKLLFDGDVIPGTKTPTQMEMEEDDTVDVMRG